MNYTKDIFNGSKFLITGGAGFIGSNIVEALLSQGYFVRVLDNFSTGKRQNIESFLDNPLFELFEGDIREVSSCQSACNDIDYVLHQGALGSVPRSIDDPITTNEVNINGTLNMMVAARDHKVKRFVYASSSSVYGDERSLPKIEDTVGVQLSPYAITKRVNELYAKNFFDLYGLKTVGLRYFNVYGKRQDTTSAYAAVIPIFVKNILAGWTSTIYGDGEQSRDFTYIDNVVQANMKACLAGGNAWGKVFNIASGERITVNHLYAKLCHLLGKNIKLIYGQERAGDVRHSNADIRLAMEILNYQPKIDFDNGIELTVDWYSNYLGMKVK